MNNTIDLTPFICEAFSSNPEVYKTIEQIYLQDRINYYRLAKNSHWYTHEIITSQSIEKEIVMKQSLGILLECDPDKLLQIIRKGWKPICNFVKNQTVVNVAEALAHALPENTSNLNRLTYDQFDSFISITAIAARVLKRDLDEHDEIFQSHINSCHERLLWMEGKDRFSLKSLSKEDKRNIRDLKNKVYADGGINRYWNTYFESFNEEMLRLHNSLSLLLDTEYLSCSIIEDQFLSEKDVEEILAAYYMCFHERSLNEAAKFLAAGHMIKALLRAYRQLKKQHFKTNNETLYLEIDTYQHEAKEARLEAKKQEWIINQKNQEIAKLQKQVKFEYDRAVSELRGDIKNKEIAISALQQELARSQSEIEELKKIAFSQEEPTDILEPVDLSTFKGVIVGGHENWHSRMKEMLPDSWRLIHPDAHIDNQIITGADIIFFYVDYLNHAMFNKILPEAKKNKIPIGYLKRIHHQHCLDDIQRRLRLEKHTMSS